jgi:hypothetical protein
VCIETEAVEYVASLCGGTRSLDFHCSAEERRKEIAEVLKERIDHWVEVAKAAPAVIVAWEWARRGILLPITCMQAIEPAGNLKAAAPAAGPEVVPITPTTKTQKETGHLKTIGARLDEARLLADISHEEQAVKIGISRTVYFEVKAGRGGRRSRRKTEIYLNNLFSDR